MTASGSGLGFTRLPVSRRTSGSAAGSKAATATAASRFRGSGLGSGVGGELRRCEEWRRHNPSPS